MRTSLGRRVRVLLATLAAAVLTLTAAPGASGATGPTVGGEQLASTGIVVDAPGAEPLPDLAAGSWVLADLDTGEVLAAKDPHGSQRPASTMKILTALTVLPQLEPEATYVARWEDANVEGSKVGIVPAATYTVHNLLEALFLVSGNDAAHALASAAGGLKSTVARMNEVARDLGALDTRAVNPSGLDAPGQFTSAYDLAVISRAAMARPDFRAYASTVKSSFPGASRAGKTRKPYEIYTQDRLLLNYRGAIGVKTGWTTKARGTFVGAATRGGRTLVATVMRTDVDAWRGSADLLTWGFRNAERATPVGTLDAAPAEAAPRQERPGKAPAQATAASIAAAGAGGRPPWWVQVPLVLLAVVVVLRARVLLIRQSRARRRARTAVATAPRLAPTMASRQRRVRPGAGEATTPSRVTGTAS